MSQETEMKVDITEVSTVVRELRFEVPWTTVKGHLERQYSEIRRKARGIRGFRKGKAPRWLLEQMFGMQVHAEVTQHIVTDALTKALIENELSPVATPELDPEPLKDGEPMSFTARVEVRPIYTDLKFDGLEVERSVHQVSDEEVDQAVEAVRQEAASLRTPLAPRPVQDGDVLVLDYDVILEGEDKPERTREDQEVELGKGALLEQVERDLIGLEVGQEKDIAVELPMRPGAEESERKGLTFRVRIKDLKEKLLPELDDEFVKDASEYETLLELRLGLRKDLEEKAEAIAENQAKDKLLDALCDANPVDVPPSLVEQQLTESQAEVARMLQIDVGKSPFNDEQNERMKEQAERKVRVALLLTQIASDAELDITDEDMEARLVEIAEQTNQPLPKIKAQFKDEQRENLRLGMLQQAVVEHIQSMAKIVDVPEETEKPEEQPSTDNESQGGGDDGDQNDDA